MMEETAVTLEHFVQHRSTRQEVVLIEVTTWPTLLPSKAHRQHHSLLTQHDRKQTLTLNVKLYEKHTLYLRFSFFPFVKNE